MNEGTVLPANGHFQLPCPVCGKSQIIGGVPGRYTYSAHYRLTSEKPIPNDNCLGSDTHVPEAELQRLVSAHR